jgi:polysaccharide biosynthesis/export protein
MQALFIRAVFVGVIGLGIVSPVAAGQGSSGQKPQNGGSSSPAGVALPPGYVIGVEDVLTIVFWRDKDMSADVVVRPDGKISLPLVNDINAAGYTPEQLRAELVKSASKYIEDPNTTVVVKEIHSRKVFVTGQVSKSGSYPLMGDMNVLQLIAHVGGLLEYADGKNIVILRNQDGMEQRFKFNYRDVVKGKKIQQNIVLVPGDTVIVP